MQQQAVRATRVPWPYVSPALLGLVFFHGRSLGIWRSRLRCVFGDQMSVFFKVDGSRGDIGLFRMERGPTSGRDRAQALSDPYRGSRQQICTYKTPYTALQSIWGASCKA